MSAYAALGEAPRTRTAGRLSARRGGAFWASRGALDGSNPTAFTTPFKTIIAAGVSLEDTAGVGADTAFVTTAISGNVVNVYGWVVAGTASTGTETVNVWAYGLL